MNSFFRKLRWLTQRPDREAQLREELQFHLEEEAEQRQATEQVRKERRALSATLDPEWVAFIDTFGCAFHPFFFFNNSNSTNWNNT